MAQNIPIKHILLVIGSQVDALCFQKNVIRKVLNYNFKGKAYCEDIFFSIQQKKQGYKHVICNKSIAIGEWTMQK